jgi:hypothetical protein
MLKGKSRFLTTAANGAAGLGMTALVNGDGNYGGDQLEEAGGGQNGFGHGGGDGEHRLVDDLAEA